MQQREVYIVQSAHLSSVAYDSSLMREIVNLGIPSEVISLLQNSVEIQDSVGKRIIKAIAKEKGITHLFYDSMHQGFARLANRFAKDPKGIKELEHILGKQGRAHVEYLKLVAECYRGTEGKTAAYETEHEIVIKLIDQLGYPGCIFPTVRWGFEQEIIGEDDEEAQAVEREMIRYDEERNNREEYQNALIAAWFLIRDRVVFQNIERYGGERNLLFMGSLHNLRDFDTPNMPFAVTRIKLYQKSFDYFARTYKISGSDELEYQITIKNREAIPDGIKEIVEKAIGEIKWPSEPL
jgi:hypothetical protein